MHFINFRHVFPQSHFVCSSISIQIRPLVYPLRDSDTMKYIINNVVYTYLSLCHAFVIEMTATVTFPDK